MQLTVNTRFFGMYDRILSELLVILCYSHAFRFVFFFPALVTVSFFRCVPPPPPPPIISRFLSRTFTLPLVRHRGNYKSFFRFRFTLSFVSFSLRCSSLSFSDSFAHSSLVPTGGEAFYGFVLMGIQLPRRVTVDLAVHGLVPTAIQRNIEKCRNIVTNIRLEKIQQK